jgi:hypothetical protein
MLLRLPLTRHHRRVQITAVPNPVSPRPQVLPNPIGAGLLLLQLRLVGRFPSFPRLLRLVRFVSGPERLVRSIPIGATAEERSQGDPYGQAMHRRAVGRVHPISHQCKLASLGLVRRQRRGTTQLHNMEVMSLANIYAG